MIKKFLCKKHYTGLQKAYRWILLSAAMFLCWLTGIPGLPEILAKAYAAELTQDTFSGDMKSEQLTQDAFPNGMDATSTNTDTLLLSQATSATADMKNSIQIIKFGISTENDQLFAYCTYQEFDVKDGMIQLYLEKKNEQGTFIPVCYADLTSANASPQTIRTSPTELLPGIYKAVLLVRQDENTPLVRFRDSDPYEVKQAGEHLSDTPNNLHPANEAENPEYEECLHSLIEKTLRAADPSHDAVLTEYCEKCGQVFCCYEVPNSAYVAFLEESMEKIKNAPPDGFVVIDTDRWVSFNEKVLDAVGERKDLSILIKYRYLGREQQTFIPANTNTTGFADENGFCGFCRMAELLTKRPHNSITPS